MAIRTATCTLLFRPSACVTGCFSLLLAEPLLPATLLTPAASLAGFAGADGDGDAAGAAGRLNRRSGVNRDSRERPVLLGAPASEFGVDTGVVLLVEEEACGVPAAGLLGSVYRTEKGWK